MNTGRADLLDRILADPTAPYALLHRTAAPDVLEVLRGPVRHPGTLAEVPLEDGAGPGHQALVVVPFRQIAERGFAARDDGTPLVALTVAEQQALPLADGLARLPVEPTRLTGGGFDLPDEAYAQTVREVVEQEIGRGAGANFVVKRVYRADIEDCTPRHALSFFRRLVRHEQGAHWTFLVHTGERTLVGASPERHLTLDGGRAVMNPISGTYRYPPDGPTLQGVMDFLADRKEADELYMVVDEELKMMARICAGGARVTGPYLKEMAQLAHTEYFIEGTSRRDVRAMLRETMFAPTVTGSPLESACRVIRDHEPGGRGYYSGVAALVGRDGRDRPSLDSAILIRTADISPAGRVEIGVGATLVRHSDPASEAAETRAKAAALLGALGAPPASGFAGHDRVRSALEARNTDISRFWFGADQAGGDALTDLDVLVVDGEDTFTSMIAHQLRHLGAKVTVCRFDEPYAPAGHDLLLLGPGPGDPRSADTPNVRQLRSAVRDAVAGDRPFVAVCLSHQLLSMRLGFPLRRRPVPNQGAQHRIDLFGSAERVGFYNAFAAHSATDVRRVPGVGSVRVSRDPATGEVHGLRGPHFASMQFHAESVLTVDGPRILGEAVAEAMRR